LPIIEGILRDSGRKNSILWPSSKQSFDIGESEKNKSSSFPGRFSILQASAILVEDPAIPLLEVFLIRKRVTKINTTKRNKEEQKIIKFGE